jgi:hypothetical protein
MARPDDDHVPRAVLGDNGEVLAVAHVSPDITPEGEAALRNLIDAVRRLDEQLPAQERAERAARQENALARVRERNRRLLAAEQPEDGTR